jgi:hypothetical protein
LQYAGVIGREGEVEKKKLLGAFRILVVGNKRPVTIETVVDPSVDDASLLLVVMVEVASNNTMKQ